MTCLLLVCWCVFLLVHFLSVKLAILFLHSWSVCVCTHYLLLLYAELLRTLQIFSIVRVLHPSFTKF